MDIKLYLILVYLIINYYLCRPLIKENMWWGSSDDTENEIQGENPEVNIPEIKVKDNDFMSWMTYLILFNLASFGFIVIAVMFRQVKPTVAPKL